MPTRFQLWWELTGVDAPLARRLWDALRRVKHPRASKVTWFFGRLERRPLAQLEQQLLLHKQHVSLHEWVELVEACVSQDVLSRREGSAIQDALCHWARQDGSWKP
jgi:hypothetical protein